MSEACKSVMFFAHDAGGANAISPLIRAFKTPLVFAENAALEILPNARRLPYGDLGEVIKSLDPSFIVTGTSGNDFTERDLWRESAKLGITSMAVLDSWVNYGVRFSDLTIRDLHLFRKDCTRLPDYICVPDLIAMDDMIKDGVPEQRILPFGNPHFEEVAANANKSNNSDVSGTRVLFASQLFDDNVLCGSELIVLDELIQVAKSYDDVKIVIRRHPKETLQKFEKYLDGSRVTPDENDDVYESVRQSETVVSVNSMVLIESLFFGKKIISFQPKSNSKDDFILTRNGTIPFINDSVKFAEYFRELYHKRVCTTKTDIKCRGIVAKITEFIEGKINGETCD